MVITWKIQRSLKRLKKSLVKLGMMDRKYMLGMKDAINLDGGGSTTLWTAKTGVINHPYDNKTFDHEGVRTVPNLIVVY